MQITTNELMTVYISDSTRPLERAVEKLKELCILSYGIDEDGHSTKVKDWERSRCSIESELVKTSFIVSSNVFRFTFKVWIDKHDN